MRLLLTLLVAASIDAGSPRARAEKAPRAPAPWLVLRVLELPPSDTRTALLSVELATTAHYSCLGYVIPARLRASGQKLRIHVGAVRAPRGPCLTALGPARGAVKLRPLAPGEYTLALEYRGREDTWHLDLTDETLSVRPTGARFSSAFDPESRTRVPPGTLEVECAERSQDPECRAAAESGLTCGRLWADPALAALATFDAKGRTFTSDAFSPDGRCFRTPNPRALAEALSHRYHDPRGCLTLRMAVSPEPPRAAVPPAHRR